ncbi:MAG TPA: response regulator transcription factor [Capillimicrobium sp.]|jgi:two-component system response regulator DesR
MRPDAGGQPAGPPDRLVVLVVDDHEVVHWGLRLMLGEQPWLERCLAARGGADAVELADRYRPHVALVDLFVGAESGPQICEQVRLRAPETRVLLISGAGTLRPNAARAAGASGFVSKDLPARELAAAVRDVGLGREVFPPQEPGAPGPVLSPREQEVLELVAVGATNREIAAALFLSPHTVKEHTSSLYRKLEARNRADAVLRAQRLGLLA